MCRFRIYHVVSQEAEFDLFSVMRKLIVEVTIKKEVILLVRMSILIIPFLLYKYNAM